jgi:hypothetical protein
VGKVLPIRPWSVRRDFKDDPEFAQLVIANTHALNNNTTSMDRVVLVDGDGEHTLGASTRPEHALRQYPDAMAHIKRNGQLIPVRGFRDQRAARLAYEAQPTVDEAAAADIAAEAAARVTPIESRPDVEPTPPSGRSSPPKVKEPEDAPESAAEREAAELAAKQAAKPAPRPSEPASPPSVLPDDADSEGPWATFEEKKSEPKAKAKPKHAPKVEAEPAQPAPDGDDSEAEPSSGDKPRMKRTYAIPSRPKGAESINDYIAEDGTIKWPDLKKIAWSGLFEPRPTCANARVAVLALGVECGYDKFHDRKLVAGHQIQEWAGEFSDHVCQMLRVIIQRQYSFDPGRENMHDAVDQLCLRNSFDPVCDYLDGLKWDGKARLNDWLVRYLGADDTELNRAIGRLSLVAAVRRARQPGCKFDQIIVLEGVEGTEKSTAIATLAGADNFSDQTILGLDDRTQAERVKGKWLYEIADLAGMRRAEVETVKAFASRTHDRARPAYGRTVVDQPRRCVFFATTNTDDYLKSQTGNRRFWPVKTVAINIDALRRDRDQLWAEAAPSGGDGRVDCAA